MCRLLAILCAPESIDDFVNFLGRITGHRDRHPCGSMQLIAASELSRPSFRGAAESREPKSVSGTAAMDSRLLAALGPGMASPRHRPPRLRQILRATERHGEDGVGRVRRAFGR